MTHKTLIAVAVLAATAIGGAAFAASDHSHGAKSGQSNAQGMAHGGGAGMAGGMGMMGGTSGMGGMGMMGGTSGMGGMGMMGDMSGMMQRMHENMSQMMDADGDGTVTPEEMRGMMKSRMAEHDANGDGSLSIDEFEALHNTMMRGMMVDRFQHLDADGDGAVTSEEMMAPAAKMERMQKMRDGMKKKQAQPKDDSNSND